MPGYFPHFELGVRVVKSADSPHSVAWLSYSFCFLYLALPVVINSYCLLNTQIAQDICSPSTMPIPKNEYLSNVWRDDIFAGKVVFCTGGAGTICSAQVRALVHLGANAAIIGRNVEKTEKMAKDIETARPGSKVIACGGVDVRSIESLTAAAEKTVKELGAIDFVMYAVNYAVEALVPEPVLTYHQRWRSRKLPRSSHGPLGECLQVSH